MEVLRVERLSKNFGGVPALRDVSFAVETGERFAIIGPNGAGKTTLFNVLNGQELPTAGRIYFFGQDITTIPIHRRAHLGQARSFQLTASFLNLTVLDNILLAIQGTKPSRFQMFRSMSAYTDSFVKAEELLDRITLWEKRGEFVRNLSCGEQRRLEIAFALASEAKLLLLDEPSSGLTSAESAEVMDMIRNQGPDVTVIVVAHDMDLVFGIAKRIMVLHYGQVIADGISTEIRADPKVKEVYLGIEEDTGIAGVS